MHPTLIAALELQSVLIGTGRPYCFIGGVALQRWGEPRFTKDADATVVTVFEFDEELIQILYSRFTSRIKDGPEFSRRSRVVLVRASNGVGLDVALGAFDFEVRCAQRAFEWNLEKGQKLRICTAEDLIVHKAFAGRDQDWADIRGVLLRQAITLNVSQIFQELGPLLVLKEDDSAMAKLKQLMRERGILSEK